MGLPVIDDAVHFRPVFFLVCVCVFASGAWQVAHILQQNTFLYLPGSYSSVASFCKAHCIFVTNNSRCDKTN